MTWRREPLRHLARLSVSNVDKKTAEDEVPVRLVNYTDVYYGDRITPSLPLMGASATPSQVSAFRVRPGDVLITKDSETAEDIGVAAFVDSASRDMVLGYHLALLRPDPAAVDGRFLYWAMCSDDVRGQLSTGATGVTRFGLRTDAIASVALLTPPLTQQRAIAALLDTETARIDALITKKRRLIGLLVSRQSALEEQLTLELPVEAVPIRWFVSVRSGEALPAEQVSEIGLTPVIGGNGLMGWTNRASLVREDSIAIGRVGALCGNVHAVDPPAWITDNALWVRAHGAFVRDYLATALRAARLNELADRTAQPLLTGEKVKSLRLPLPSRSEQDAVCQAVERSRSRIELLAIKLEEQIRLLRERRKALITAAVTGEIEIPGVAA